MLHSIEKVILRNGLMDDGVDRLRPDVDVDFVPSLEKPDYLAQDEGL